MKLLATMKSPATQKSLATPETSNSLARLETPIALKVPEGQRMPLVQN